MLWCLLLGRVVADLLLAVHFMFYPFWLSTALTLFVCKQRAIIKINKTPSSISMQIGESAGAG